MINILYQGNPGQLQQIRKYFDSSEIHFDSRSLSSVKPGSAGILANYDILAFDLTAPIYISSAYDEKISAFLHEKSGVMIFILREEYTETYNGPEGQVIISSHDILRTILKTEGHEPEDLEFKPNPSYEIVATALGKNSIIKNYFNDSQYNIHVILPYNEYLPIQPLALDKEKNTAAFSIKPFSSQIFIVPPKNGNELVEIIKYVLPTIDKSSIRLGNVPEWVLGYPIPGLEKLTKTLNEKTEKLEKLEKQIESKKMEKEELENIRNILLYGKNDILHDTVLLVLNLIGFDAIKGPRDAQDIEFHHKNNQFVCEVKGRDKSIKKMDISQLAGFKDQTENEKEVKVKGILIANPWRKLPIEQRNTKDKPNFPNSIKKLVELKELCLITTAQIFAIYCHWKEDNKSINVNQIMEDLYTTTDVYSKYTDLNKVALPSGEKDK